MKYKLTWKDIIVANAYKFFVVGFPIYLILVLFIVLLMDFIEGRLGYYSISDYMYGIITTIPMIIIIYASLVVFLCITSWKYWKNNIIWEHELKVTKDSFIWKSRKQEVKTSLSLLKNFVVQRKKITIKFEGIRKAKISKKWIISGYDEFISDMTHALNQKESQWKQQ